MTMLNVEDRHTPADESAIRTLAHGATEFLFFTGKGGVGKTSVACAVAVTLADEGKRVLIVSTDPASNLDEVLATPLTDVPRPVDGLSNLHASNLDPESAAASYREALVGPYRGILPDATVASMEEQLSGACTVEIAAFNEFAKLVGDDSATQGYDVVIFDTAPTGHTLRLLTLPTAWTDFIETNTTGNSCLGPLAGLKAQRELYARTVKALADGDKTTLVMVSRPDVSALNEAARSSAELADLGIRNQRLVLNGLFSTVVPDDPIASALERRGIDALRRVPAALADLPRVEVPLIVRSPLGIDGLRQLADAVTGTAQPTSSFATGLPFFPETTALSTLVDDLAEAGSGVVMTMGKGGVGKTTIAAAIALELVRRGHPVHLSTTDPAAHVAEAVADFSGGLTLSRIDPEVEVAAYRQLVLDGAADLGPEALALLEEDLRSPCTEEIAVFRAFARTVAEATDRFVILDTAPTGHTLLLIDSSEAYHREVMRNTTDTPPEVLELLPRLRDANFTKVLVVTLAEATPVSEARRLQDDLRRAGIEPYGWVVNQSFAPVVTADPVLRARGLNEVPHIESVVSRDGKRVVLVPWVPVPPVGEGLAALIVAGNGDGEIARYVYYCDECETSFETMIEHPDRGVPAQVTCPDCGSDATRRLYAADEFTPAGGCCPPGTGCCGTPGSA
jgi:arsenite-transporting ATPase